jgi:hypothetical protein
MTTMRSWLRKLMVSSTMGGALAAALLFGAATEASAQNWGGYGYSQGHQGHNHGSSYGSSYYGDSGYGRSGYGSSGYGNYRYSQPTYHAPSLHYDRVYHPEVYHWTPSRGLHTHGHYDTVPHYTPGHVHY